MKNKKGQVISITAFFVITLSVFVAAFILMSLVNTVLNPVEIQLGNQSELAGATVGAVNSSFNTWWDIAIMLFFFFNVLILMISAFLVDIHPAFLIIYIMAAFLLIIFGGNVVGAINDLWSDSGSFSDATAEMPMVVWMLNHFTLVILSIVVISGIIMYAKFKWGGTSNF
jgi:hypothetical protein